MKRLFACTLMLIATAPSLAADVNGYTAKYECRAGGSNCDVDVATLVAKECQQTIQPSDPWSAINWSNNVICIAAGDHSAKGTLTIGGSGTAAARKVLRYYRGSDNNDDPWNQPDANRARLYAINVDGNDYWVIHRLTVDPDYAGVNGIKMSQGSKNNIVNRVLVQKTDLDAIFIQGSKATADTSSDTIQNSVVRSTKNRTGTQENQCITVVNAEDIRVVNNEIYDCNKGSHVPANSTAYGFVVENNDVYVSPAQYTDCEGNFDPNGGCAAGEVLISWKSAGSSSKPAKIIHNRLWGGKPGDGLVSQGGTGAPSKSISISNGDISGTQNPDQGADYVLVQNNIIFDNEIGIWNYWNGPNNVSVIGNMLFNIRRTSSLTKYPEKGALTYWRINDSEWYLNTVISAPDSWLNIVGTSNTNNDIWCNVAIDSGAQRGAGGTGTQQDYNGYYGTPPAGEYNKKGNYALKIVSGTLCTYLGCTSTIDTSAYSIDDVLRTSSTLVTSCASSSDQNCFLYRVTSVGVSGQVQAIRGPFSFFRKLRTSSEKYTIPYARAHTSAPETNYCPGNYASRKGIGISDE